MKVESTGDWSNSEVLVLAIGENWKDSIQVKKVDEATNGWLSRLIGSEDISIKPLKTSVHLSPEGLKQRVLITVGIGAEAQYDAVIAFRAAAVGCKIAAGKKRISVAFAGFPDKTNLARASVAGSMNGCIGQDLYRQEKSLHAPESILWVGLEPAELELGKALGIALQHARRLVNLPPNVLYPETFVEEAKKILEPLGIEIEVWDKARLEQERCGSLLGVARGSTKEPRLMIMRYAGKKQTAPIALVGKGVTFDSGGLSIKPTDGMLTMKCDMAGAATVVSTLYGIATRAIDQPVIGIVGLVENMLDGDCFRLGDVLTARSGKTIEIHNTDAEGRLVLADALNVALDYKPSQIIDFATLTGACVVALGTEITGMMGNSSVLEGELQATAKKHGEYLWPLPMHSFFTEQISGKIADIKNVGEGRWGGAITAAKFLEEFVAATPWMHFDIAGPAFYDSPKPWLDQGGTGVMVRTMIEWLSEK